MTEEETIRTEQDLAIEKLMQRIEALETSHKAEVEDLRKANAGLWAQLHPAMTEPEPAPQPEPVWDTGRAIDAFAREMGIISKE